MNAGHQFDLLEDLEACLYSIECGDFEYDIATDYDRCPHCQVRMAVKSNNQ